MPHTQSIVTITDYIVDKLKDNYEDLGLNQRDDVYYGDQDKLPRSPAICIDTGRKQRQLAGVAVARRTENTFLIYIIVYHGEVRNSQVNRRDADVLAEQVETLLHQDPTFGGLVIHGFVKEIVSGYSRKANSTYRSARLAWEGQTKLMIP